MGVSSVSNKTRYILWGRAAGRCQFEGCNEELYKDPTTQSDFNQAYVAHIIADKPGGPRGDDKLSPLLRDDVSNLMLLCDRHHRLIDNDETKDNYPTERLRAMKKAHETRIRISTSIHNNKKSHIVLFGSRIGEHEFPLTYEESAQTINPEYYPTENSPIEIGIKGAPQQDSEDEYWKFQDDSLQKKFSQELARIKEKNQNRHFSIFGLAPIPLLIRLGTLLSDLYPAKVYTRFHEPSTWEWQNDGDSTDFDLIPPKEIKGKPVLNISITADISPERIKKVVGNDSSIWKLTVQEPGKDLIRSKNILKKFRQKVRELFESIKKVHGQDATLHVFPAMPNSTSIEFGRVWMPKSELPMVIYDQNASRNGFIETITISKTS